MPIREACHVAVQRSHPSKHKLWRHAQARQQAKGQGPIPVLQIVCHYLITLISCAHLCVFLRVSGFPGNAYLICSLFIFMSTNAITYNNLITIDFNHIGIDCTICISFLLYHSL